MQIDAKTSREYRATMLAVRAVDRTLRKQIRVQTKKVAAPEWQRALGKRATTELERRVLVNTAVVSVSDQNVRVQSASKGRKLSGGLLPKLDYPAIEFGADRGKRSTYRRTARGGAAHSVTRRTNTGLRPRNGEGYVFYPTAREMVPRMGRLWAQTTVRTIANALEGKQE